MRLSLPGEHVFTYLWVGRVRFASELIIKDLDLQIFKARIDSQLPLERSSQSWPLRQ
jgi:hypothetical protein